MVLLPTPDGPDTTTSIGFGKVIRLSSSGSRSSWGIGSTAWSAIGVRHAGADAGGKCRTMDPDLGQRRRQVARQLAPGSQPPAIHRAVERQSRRVQELALKVARARTAAVPQVAGD